jgi:hypothetical protein
MIWFKPEKLSSKAKQAAVEWNGMHPDIPGHPVVIPITPNSAVIEYVGETQNIWCVFYYPLGSDEPLFVSQEDLKRKTRSGRRRKLYSRACVARQEYVDAIRVPVMECLVDEL